MKVSTRINIMFFVVLFIPIVIGVFAYSRYHSSLALQEGMKKMHVELNTVLMLYDIELQEIRERAELYVQDKYVRSALDIGMDERLEREFDERIINDDIDYLLVLGSDQRVRAYGHSLPIDNAVFPEKDLQMLSRTESIATGIEVFPRNELLQQGVDVRNIFEQNIIVLTATAPMMNREGTDVIAKLLIRRVLTGRSTFFDKISRVLDGGLAFIHSNSIITATEDFQCGKNGQVELSLLDAGHILRTENIVERSELEETGKFIVYKRINDIFGYPAAILMLCSDAGFHLGMQRTGVVIAAIMGLIGCVALVSIRRLIGSAVVLPIDRMVKVSRQIAMGNYRARVDSYSGEMGILAKSLNRMAEDLEKSHESVLRSEKTARIILNASPFSAFLIDFSGMIVDVNSFALKNLNIEGTRLKGRFLRSITGVRVLDGVYDEFIKVLDQQEPLEWEREQGMQLYHYRLIPVVDEKQNIDVVALFIRDITPERAREAQLAQNRNLALMGQMSAGVAHEVNNPNNYIRMYATLIKRIWNDVSPVLRDTPFKPGATLGGLDVAEALQEFPKMLEGIETGSDRIKHIVAQMKDVVNQGRGRLNLRPSDINRIVMSAVGMLTEKISHHTDFFQIDLDRNIPEGAVLADPRKFEQVVINLVTNALESLESKNKRIVVSTQLFRGESCVMLKIRDEGKGISKEQLGRLPEPFYTTKQSHGGLGLGLAISYSIIKEHNGTVAVESTVGVGSIFSITLPLVG